VRSTAPVGACVTQGCSASAKDHPRQHKREGEDGQRNEWPRLVLELAERAALSPVALGEIAASRDDHHDPRTDQNAPYCERDGGIGNEPEKGREHDGMYASSRVELSLPAQARRPLSTSRAAQRFKVGGGMRRLGG
jgi:hypothetical protein